MIKLYCIGLCILIIAIAANALIGKLGVMSWYDLLNGLGEKGMPIFKSLSIFDYLWLFIIYPLVLGAGYKMGEKLYELIF